MKYRVKIVVTEAFSTWVEADNEEDATEAALQQMYDGKLALDYENFDTSIIDEDDE